MKAGDIISEEKFDKLDKNFRFDWFDYDTLEKQKVKKGDLFVVQYKHINEGLIVSFIEDINMDVSLFSDGEQAIELAPDDIRRIRAMTINEFAKELQEIKGYVSDIEISTAPYQIDVTIYKNALKDQIITKFEATEPEDIFQRIIETLQ